MNGPEFHRTSRGQQYYCVTLPRLVEQLTRIANQLERVAKALEDEPAPPKSDQDEE